MSEPRCYSVATILAKLEIGRRTFYTLKAAGKLPFLEEIQPSLSQRSPRYRADLVDRWIANQWQSPRALGAHRRVG